MKIYVASSWRNQIQQEIVVLLSEQGFEVYDFKNPSPGNHGFHWSEIDPNWKNWTSDEFKKGLKHDIALAGFYSDMSALDECDVCVLVLPSGRSAHLETGWAIGANKPTIIYTPEAVEPELMYLMAPFICTDIHELLSTLNDIKIDLRRCRVCGCTDDNACFGGCHWVADDLCSACVAHHGGEVEQINENTR